MQNNIILHDLVVDTAFVSDLMSLNFSDEANMSDETRKTYICVTNIC